MNERVLRDILEIYAAEAEWSNTATIFLESGEYPDADGNSPEIELDYEMPYNNIFDREEDGYKLAKQALREVGDELEMMQLLRYINDRKHVDIGRGHYLPSKFWGAWVELIGYIEREFGYTLEESEHGD